MMTNRIWSTVALLTVIGAFASVDSRQSVEALNFGCVNNSQCGCTPEQEALNCSEASGAGGFCNLNGSMCQCNPGFAEPNCAPLGACCGVEIGAQLQGPGFPCTDTTEQTCTQLNGTYAGDGTTCVSGPCNESPVPTQTPTPTETATATPTATPVPQGGDCVDASECAPGLFCSDLVCCDTACDAPDETCVADGEVGTCVQIPAPAPAASGAGLLAMLAALAVSGLFGLRALRRS
jgi:hypothetical protein